MYLNMNSVMYDVTIQICFLALEGYYTLPAAHRHPQGLCSVQSIQFLYCHFFFVEIRKLTSCLL